MTWDETEAAWSGEYTDTLICQMVSQNDLSTVIGELPTVASSVKVTEAYYTDERESMTLDTDAPWLWDGYAALRIIHETSFGATETHTFLPTGDGGAWQHRGRTSSITGASPLHAWATDVYPRPWTIGEGAKASDALVRMCDNSARPYVFDPTWVDSIYQASHVFDPGTSMLKMAFQVMDDCGGRLGVAPDGRVLFSRYVAPSAKTPTFALYRGSPLLIDGGWKRTSNLYSVPTSVYASYGSGDTLVVGSAFQPSGSPYSRARRGYTVSANNSLSAAPENQAAADATAATDLASATDTSEWTVPTLLFPVHAGDAGTFDPGEVTDPYGAVIDTGGPRRVMVKTAEKDLGNHKMQLTLKEL